MTGGGFPVVWWYLRKRRAVLRAKYGMSRGVAYYTSYTRYTTIWWCICVRIILRSTSKYVTTVFIMTGILKSTPIRWLKSTRYTAPVAKYYTSVYTTADVVLVSLCIIISGIRIPGMVYNRSYPALKDMIPGVRYVLRNRAIWKADWNSQTEIHRNTRHSRESLRIMKPFSNKKSSLEQLSCFLLLPGTVLVLLYVCYPPL